MNLMSRFVEILNQHRGEITMRTLPAILDEIKKKLDAECSQIEVRFPSDFRSRCGAPTAQAPGRPGAWEGVGGLLPWGLPEHPQGRWCVSPFC